MRQRLAAWVRRALGRAPPFILMYHRVSAVPCDPWGLAVAPDRFAAQIETLVRSYRPVRLAQIADGTAPDRSVAVTFDDGHLDNLTHAKPTLDRFECPATVFVTTGFLDSPREFWWDELARLVLGARDLPDTLELPIAEDASEAQLATTGSSRASVHQWIWSTLLPLDPERRTGCLDRLAAQIVTAPPAAAGDRPLSRAELCRLASGLIEIGAHTVTHPDLPTLDPAAQRAQARDSRRTLAELTGTPVRHFAYPFGRCDRDSIAAVRDAGFAAACMTRHGPVTRRSRPLELPRVQIGNWDAEAFARRLQRQFVGGA